MNRPDDNTGSASPVHSRILPRPTWLSTLKSDMARRLWLAAYALEECRTRYADHGLYMRSAACCVGLAALRLIGGHA